MKNTTILEYSIKNAKKHKRKRINFNDVKTAVKQVGGHVNMPAAYFNNNHAGYYPFGSESLNTPQNFVTDSCGVLRVVDGSVFTGPNLYPWSPHMSGGAKKSKMYKNITFTNTALNAINYFSK